MSLTPTTPNLNTNPTRLSAASGNQNSSRPATSNGPPTGGSTAAAAAAATDLASAIDEFLGDLDKKFKVIGDEILSKLDDMTARCDRIEAELLMRDSTPKPSSRNTSKDLGATGGGDGD